MIAAATLPIAESLAPSVARADLFGDIGVLLAQLEQQLQLVSHAISTVQNLMATVDRLNNVMQHTKMVLKHAGQGGLKGLLGDAQEFLSIARGVTADLQRIDYDAKWWDTNIIEKLLSNNPNPADQRAAQNAFRQMDQDRIKNAQQMNVATQKLVSDSNEATAAAVDATNEGQTTDGVVGQMQLLSRINTQHARIARNQAQMTAALVDANNAELARLAAEREANRISVEGAMKGLGDQPTSEPVDLPYAVEGGWGQ
jgi:hypothetical protein